MECRWLSITGAISSARKRAPSRADSPLRRRPTTGPRSHGTTRLTSIRTRRRAIGAALGFRSRNSGRLTVNHCKAGATSTNWRFEARRRKLVRRSSGGFVGSNNESGARRHRAQDVHQVVQEIKSGKLNVTEIPAPLAQPGEVLIANVASVISAGTERMVIDLAKKSLLGKARDRPDLVRRVIEKCRNEGLLNTMRQVREQLDTPLAMGYSSAGVVLACGRGVQQFKPGDRVASNGSHAEIVSVSRHLCAAVPENVDFEQAAFAVLGAIALNGVRLSGVKLGETVFVIGLGL